MKHSIPAKPESISTDIVWHQHNVTHHDRVSNMGHQPAVLWFTGLSGSGKSTIANAVESLLYQIGTHTYLLDGDNIRHGLNQDLDFSEAARQENIRRLSEVAALFVDAGLLVLTAFISPFQEDRAKARAKMPSGRFIEIFIDTSLAECERRDPKQLYQKARRGEIANFTGISAEYQAPTRAEIHIKTDGKTVEQCALEIIHYLDAYNFISFPALAGR